MGVHCCRRPTNMETRSDRHFRIRPRIRVLDTSCRRHEDVGYRECTNLVGGSGVTLFLLIPGRFGDQSVALELVANGLTDAAGLELTQKSFELEEFPIVGVVEPGFNGNAVVDLVSKGMGRVVHQNGPGEVAT